MEENKSDGTETEKPESQTELVFTLMALHGVETSDDLPKKTGMDLETLVTRTNLQHMVQFRRTKAVELIEQSEKAFRVLP